MSLKHQKTDKKKNRWPIILAVFFLVVILAGLGGLWVFETSWAQKFYPGTSVGYLDLSGKTFDQAQAELGAVEKNVRDRGLIFSYQDTEVSIAPIVITVADPDLAKPLLTFDWQKTLEPAFTLGRSGNWLNRLSIQFKTWLGGYQAPVVYQLDRPDFRNTLESNFSKFETPAKNAELKIENVKAEISEEKSGQEFDYSQALDLMEERINNLNFEPIILKIMAVEPMIKKEHAGSALNSLERILAIDSVKLTADPYWWRINQPQFVDWLEFQVNEGEVVIGFNKEKVLDYLVPIAQTVNVEARDAKFKIEGERVTEFQSSRDGQQLKLDESYQKINQQIIEGKSDDIALVVEVALARVSTAEANNLGIAELIGRGTTNFAGSPINRRYNISVGANSLNGLLIEPDEEFSLLKALGEIGASTGYRQELVIKGDRTIPEYGGGLCQIGTTTFRVVLASGLPIAARRNHSYRVSYYEPPVGMDATIYDPAPDFKFVNDTGNYILFTTHIEGDDLIFEFYGTDDGRVATTTEPIAYNRVGPGEPRYIETEELAPGEKKKVESAHAGLDASFDYTVTYPNGEVKKETFTSHYVPWKETWLVGKEPTTTPETTEPVVEQ